MPLIAKPKVSVFAWTQMSRIGSMIQSNPAPNSLLVTRR